MIRQLNIGIVLYRNCTSSMVTGFWDILTLANQLHQQKSNTPLFHLELIAESKMPINSFSGLTFTASKSIQTNTHYDLIYIPGFLGNVDEVLALENKTIRWLAKIANSGKTVLTAACNGNFLLASSGALDHKKATTHWSLIQKFKTDYKSITLQPEKIIVDNGAVISAAGVTAYFNLGLYIIQRFANPELALSCAKIFLVDAGRKI